MITTTDPISDMLTRIRNAINVNKTEVSLPHSTVKENVAKVLQQNHFIESVKVTGEKTEKTLHIVINAADKNAKINEISRVSKPGQRSYVNVKEIPVIKQGRGMVVVSTSQGLMSGDDARKANIGGELILKVF
ncbi:MAG: 30S ribosomal protein S8 [bacterium]|jgi:small subunit ribosomal protein S8